jgi:hypothetical protein
MGQLGLLGLLQVLPAWAADRMMTTITLIGFGASILWLRWKAVGNRGLNLAVLLCALLSINLCWIYGFTSYMLGACLYAITIGVWWGYRERLGAGRICLLGALLFVGFFCHPVTVGLTALSLLFLSILAPIEGIDGASWQWRGRLLRLVKTSISVIPVILLVLNYRQISAQGGPMAPIGDQWTNPLSPKTWIRQVLAAEPISICRKLVVPFTEWTGPAAILLLPIVWFAIAVTIWLFIRTGINVFRGNMTSSVSDGTFARPAAGTIGIAGTDEGGQEASERVNEWKCVLSEHAATIDAVVTGKDNPQIDDLSERYFDRVEEREEVRVFRSASSRAGAAHAPGTR